MFDETEEQIADNGEETQETEETQEGGEETQEGGSEDGKEGGKPKLTDAEVELAQLRAENAKLRKDAAKATPEPYEKLTKTRQALAQRAQEKIAGYKASLKAEYPSYTDEQRQILAEAMAINDTAPVLDQAYDTMASEYRSQVAEMSTRDIRLELTEMGVNAQTIDQIGNNPDALAAMRDELKKGRGEDPGKGKTKTKVKTLGGGATGGGGSGGSGAMTEAEVTKRMAAISAKITQGKELTESDKKFRDDFRNNRLEYRRG